MDMKKIIFAIVIVAATMSFTMATGPADKPAAGGAGAGAGGAAAGAGGAAAGGTGAATGGAGAAHAPSAATTTTTATTAPAPAPGPASAAVYSALPAFGSLFGASLVTLFAYYFQ